MNSIDTRLETINPDSTKEKVKNEQEEIWIVDNEENETDNLNDILDDFFKKNPYTASVKIFQTGESVIEHFETMFEKDQTMPKIIILDGSLEDNGDFNTGRKVIEKIKELIKDSPGVKLPTIIAHSGKDKENKNMEEAGASYSLLKGESNLDQLKIILTEKLKEEENEL